MTKRIAHMLLFCSLFLNLKPQSWLELMSKPDANYYEIKTAFDAYFSDKDITERGNGYKQFKRWEYLVAPRVFPSGELSLMQQCSANFQEFLLRYRAGQSAQKSLAAAQSGTWVAVGPFGAPLGSLGGVQTGAGKDNGITFFPGNPSKFFVCSANGGLWETSNGGIGWTTNHEQLPTGACTDLLIDPVNTNIMYLATGGGDTQMGAYTDPSSGVYKSSDGGISWNPTGLTYSLSQIRFIHKLAMDPANNQIIYAATNAGLMRSTNAGTTWSLALSAPCWDIKFNPGNASIIYVAGNTSFYRSGNSGSSFAVISSGIPVSGAYRMSLAVTPANPNCVYVLACKNSDYNFMGLYRSVDSGLTFTTMSTSPNLIGVSCAGNSAGTGTGWWNCSIAASPSNSNEVVVGGVNAWRSLNGGQNWSLLGCWNSNSSNWLHADIHELEYDASGVLYSCNDGGTYYYNGSTWVSVNGQRNIAEVYRIGMSALTADLWISGHQDNGSNTKNGLNYTYTFGGDGMDCFIDRTNDQYRFCSFQNGAFRISTNGGSNWSTFTSGLSGSADWVAPWKQDPQNPALLYAGYSQLYKCTLPLTSWTALSNTGGGGTIKEFAIAPSNNQIIYVIHGSSIRKTIDGGNSWTNISTAFGGQQATDISVSPVDPDKVWVCVSGYSAGNKVFFSYNGGSNWINITSNLPNIPANALFHEPGTNDRIYLGMDIGVYYKDNSSPNWTLYNNGMPPVTVMDIEMTPAKPGKLFAATFGRGIYEADAIQSSAVPSPSFSYYGALCAGEAKALVDNSSETPTTWSWSVSPSTGVVFNSPSIQSPTVFFSNPGTYTISLVSGNAFGMGTVYSQTILVESTPVLNLSVSDSVTICQSEPLTITASGAQSYTWSNGGGNNASVTYSPTFNWTYSLTGANGGCISKKTVYVSLDPCTGSLELLSAQQRYRVFPNPADDRISVEGMDSGPFRAELFDLSGKLLRSQSSSPLNQKQSCTLNTSALSSGIYLLSISSEEGKVQARIVKE